MNQNNNGTIFVGALIGAGIGYLVADWYIETYIPEEGFELEPVDRIARFKERLAKKDTVNMTRAANGVAPVRSYTEFFQKKQGLSEIVKTYGGDPNEPEPEDELLAEDGLLTDIDEDEDETEEMTDDGNDPGIISVAVYAADEEFTHTTLRYYTDDVLTDEAGVPVNRPEKFLPENALVSFGEMSGDEDIVYIRNTEKKCMYEIVRMDTPYTSLVFRHSRRVPKVKEMGNVTGEDD